jgi:large subunit ribosomal protein L13e
MNHAEVIKPRSKLGEKRVGRGFSVNELKEAGLSLDEAKKLGIYIDKRRKTAHPWNIEYLKKLRASN